MANERSSGTAFFSSKDEKPVLAGAHDYFVNNVLPSDIKACIRNIKAPTLYVNNHDETFLLVRSYTNVLNNFFPHTQGQCCGIFPARQRNNMFLL